ncbi:hypothetical protein SEA_LIGMA_20 [Gordonia phage Ligma]|nr:hypothetical protein SEA_LIGMA_20 [Gordonia phage Ligma]UQT02121.1 hypothetical protein SEA_AXUMITE_20 [Gordonia phage Axumite]
MTSVEPMCSDPTDAVIAAFTTAMREAFAPDSECPPIGGGTTDVRLFAGDGIPLAAWNAHADGEGCDHPFLWVRLTRRYRTQQFPTPVIDTSPCTYPRVVAVEVGVGRCAVVDLQPSWEDYDREAQTSIDDGWRIELALCRARALLTKGSPPISSAFATDAITPYGPEGGVVAMTGIGYVQID